MSWRSATLRHASRYCSALGVVDRELGVAVAAYPAPLKRRRAPDQICGLHVGERKRLEPVLRRAQQGRLFRQQGNHVRFDRRQLSFQVRGEDLLRCSVAQILTVGPQLDADTPQVVDELGRGHNMPSSTVRSGSSALSVSAILAAKSPITGLANSSRRVAEADSSRPICSTTLVALTESPPSWKKLS